MTVRLRAACTSRLMLAVALGLAGWTWGLDTGLAAQQARANRARGDYGVWLAAVERHAPGEPDAAVREIAPWTAFHFKLIDWELSRLSVKDAHWTRVRKRAAILHTDVGIFGNEARAGAPTTSRPSGRWAAAVADGRFQGYIPASDHWAFARSLLDGVHPAPSRDEAVRDWYRAAAAWLVGARELYELRDHLARGRTLFRRDAVLAMLEGVRHQVLASARVQASLDGRSRRERSAVGEGAEELRQAAAEYRDALRLDPDLVEARVRLGRVLADQGLKDAAVRELRLALSQAGDPVLAYYAALLLGEAAAALGQADEARRAYERARSVFPAAPSPCLGLSQLARARGDRAESGRWLEEALALAAAADADDPWWDFNLSAGRQAQHWLSAVRAAFAGAPSP